MDLSEWIGRERFLLPVLTLTFSLSEPSLRLRDGALADSSASHPKQNSLPSGESSSGWETQCSQGPVPGPSQTSPEPGRLLQPAFSNINTQSSVDTLKIIIPPKQTFPPPSPAVGHPLARGCERGESHLVHKGRMLRSCRAEGRIRTSKAQNRMALSN